MIPITSRPVALPDRPAASIRPAAATAAAAADATAAGFETLFMGMVMKAMRSPALAPGLFDSDAARNFRDMLDNQLLSDIKDKGTGVGRMLADALPRREEPR